MSNVLKLDAISHLGKSSIDMRTLQRSWPLSQTFLRGCGLQDKIIDNMPHYLFSFDGENALDLDTLGRDIRFLPPACFMHFGWPTEERVQEHMEYYRSSGLIAGMVHPLEFGGAPSLLEDWMIE